MTILQGIPVMTIRGAGRVVGNDSFLLTTLFPYYGTLPYCYYYYSRLSFSTRYSLYGFHFSTLPFDALYSPLTAETWCVPTSHAFRLC